MPEQETAAFRIQLGGAAYEIQAALSAHEAPMAKDVAAALLAAMSQIAKTLGASDAEFMHGAALATLAMALSARNQKSALDAAAKAFAYAFTQKPGKSGFSKQETEREEIGK